MSVISLNSVSVNAGDTVINVSNAPAGLSKILKSSVITVDNYAADIPVIGGDDSGTITLESPWGYGNVSNAKARVQIGFDALAKTGQDFKAASEFTSNVGKLLSEQLTEDNAAKETPLLSGGKHVGPTIEHLKKTTNALNAQAASLVGSVQAMTKAEFFALSETRKNQYAGSGFIEAGLNNPSASRQVNDGLNTIPTNSNVVYLGRGSDGVGTSRSNYPIFNINGMSVYVSENLFHNEVRLPNAPDGLDKNDGTRYADLAAAIVDGGTSLSNSVLTRQDLILLEVWHEKISDKDVVYPLGNVQYGVSSWQSVALSNSLVVQGYSAFEH
ncbi:hypothetical protein [Thalassotalea euphylliae]|uniref:Uncharacterized protein n=1 Tax=Thalassotalea euphylliae TaxID=1655234 RepID=A0A3E0U6C1_9GAMM|nr:hypothetical protein [Thalassotalea euphylliae]REL32531.1 hypothetical protein DXX94_18445 [Thalassotalea euphylliae]